MKIKISDIKVNPSRREASLNGIGELTRSISDVGLLNPITVDPDHTLIAGLHRMEAAKRLGNWVFLCGRWSEPWFIRYSKR